MKKLVYENVPAGAKENSENSITYKQDFVNEQDFKEQLTVDRFATLEKDYWRLNGTFKVFPDNPKKIGYISTLMSDENCEFSKDIIFTRIYDKKYSSPGFQFEFDIHENNHPISIEIKWYRDNEIISEKLFEVKTASCICHNNVEAFDKVIIVFSGMNNPYRYLKIFNIDDGFIQTFYKDSLVNLKVLEEISSTSEELSINTLSVTLLNNENFDLLFLRTLPIRLYKDDNLIGAFFIKSSSETSTYKISCNDWIYILDNSEYVGGFFENVDAEIILNEILAEIPYELDEELKHIKINGYLSIQSKRLALQEVAFSIGAIVDCSRNDKVKITKASNEITKEIGKDRIFEIDKNQDSITTHIILVEHNYKLSTEKEELFNDVLNGSTKIVFNSPAKNLEIENGEILESHVNYAIINGFGTTNTILKGNIYKDTTTEVSKENPAISFIDLVKEKKYNSTLITKRNSMEVINRLGFINKKLSVRFILNDERVGDVVLINNYKARILSLSYDFNSNVIVATSDMEVLT